MNENDLWTFPWKRKKTKKLNEWMTQNDLWTFTWKRKKTTTKQEKNGEKKHKQLLFKKNGTSSKSDWMTDELFRGKKKQTGFSDLNEWTTNVHVRVKKKYGTFGNRHIFVGGNQNYLTWKNIETPTEAWSSFLRKPPESPL